MRDNPSLGFSDVGAAFVKSATNSTIGTTGISAGLTNTYSSEVKFNVSSGLVAGNATNIGISNNKYLQLDARL